MAGEELFEGLAAQMARKTMLTARGAPRLRAPERDQIELRAVDIDSLIGQDHPVRVIWGYVEGLDLSLLEDRIRAREHTPGHPPIAPRLLLALWLYATSEGVGSARALERLCASHDVYRWLCGGVSVNYHTLADFRVDCADPLIGCWLSMWRRWPGGPGQSRHLGAGRGAGARRRRRGVVSPRGDAGSAFGGGYYGDAALNPALSPPCGFIPVTLRCERSEPRRATARASGRILRGPLRGHPG